MKKKITAAAALAGIVAAATFPSFFANKRVGDVMAISCNQPESVTSKPIFDGPDAPLEPDYPNGDPINFHPSLTENNGKITLVVPHGPDWSQLAYSVALMACSGKIQSIRSDPPKERIDEKKADLNSREVIGHIYKINPNSKTGFTSPVYDAEGGKEAIVESAIPSPVPTLMSNQATPSIWTQQDGSILVQLPVLGKKREGKEPNKPVFDQPQHQELLSDFRELLEKWAKDSHNLPGPEAIPDLSSFQFGKGEEPRDR